MNLVADESVDFGIVQALRCAGYDVIWIAELAPGIKDEDVLSLGRESSRTLLTADKDFGELSYRRKEVHHGVVLLRLHGLSPSEKIDRVLLFFADHQNDLKAGFAVIQKNAFRIRGRL